MNGTLDDFGPQLEGSFDFTLLFEQSILSIIPSSLLICIATVRIARLSVAKVRARGGKLLRAKLVTAGVLFCLQLASLVVWTLPAGLRTRASVPAAALSLVEAAFIGALVYFEHRRSVRPSKLLTGVLVLTTLLDLAQARTLFRAKELTPVAVLFSAGLATKVAILFLEELPKRSLLSPESKKEAALETTSGPLNRTVFWWLNAMFKKGFRGLLVPNDLSVIDKKFKSEALLFSLGQQWRSCDIKRKHSLAIATIWAFKGTCGLAAVPRLCLSGFRFSQPFLIERVVDFVGEPARDDSRGVAGGLVGATALIYIGMAASTFFHIEKLRVTSCYYHHINNQLMTQVRGGLVALIYEKTMHLDTAAARDGGATTLMSADIEGIEPGVPLIHEVWASALELGIGLYLLQRQVGAACFLIIIPATLASLITSRLTKTMGPARMLWSKGIQQRVAATTNMLAQIKSLKMMGLANQVAESIQALRIHELDVSKKLRLALIKVFSTSQLSSQMTPVVIVAGTVFWTKRGDEQELNVAEIFSTLSIVALVSEPISQLMSCLPNIMASVACFDTIQEYLELEIVQDNRKGTLMPRSRSSDELTPPVGQEAIGMTSVVRKVQETTAGVGADTGTEAYAVTIEDGFFTPTGQDEPVLQSINVALRPSTCTMIVGPVGSGKSTLLSVILGETSLTRGTVRVNHQLLGYCSQNPWLRNIAIRDNILAQTDYDREWYNTVVRACGLDRDMALFPRGDATSVGSGGVALSGGQKHRVALARCIYSRKPIIVLDDVLSALDNTTSRLVFDRLLGEYGLLKRTNSTVIMATHAVHHLPSADHIVVLSQGGAIVQQGTYTALSGVEGYVRSLALEDASRTEASDDHPEDAVPSTPEEEETPVDAEILDLTRQSGDASLYKFYFQSVSTFMAIVWLSLASLYIGLTKLPQIWIRLWAEQGLNSHSGLYFGIYVALSLACVVVYAISVIFFMITLIPKSAEHLHELFLGSVIRAPLSFFSTTDSGGTLNRFTQDMTLLSNRLPISAYHFIYNVLSVLLSTALIAAGAQYVGAVIPFSMICVYLLGKFYLRTSRQMRYLDLEAKAPLFTLFTETVDGLATIRAFGWQRALLEHPFFARLDASQRPYYLMFCLQRWLAVVLDLFIAGVAVVLVAFATGFRGGGGGGGGTAASQGALGVAMVNLIAFNTELSELVDNWADLETSLGAVARLRSFLRDTPSEGGRRPGEEEDQLLLPGDGWPSAGRIEFRAVTAGYSVDTDPVLRDVSLTIEPGQKIGICGRTGSGKSSLILAMLRLLEIRSGSIRIDGIDLSTLSRDAIRSHVLTLPQDPVILPGTVRANLTIGLTVAGSGAQDTTEQQQQHLISALTKVKLWTLVRARGGLDAEFEALGLSQGQRQLFCLARALLLRETKNKSQQVLLLDEPTSSLDRETDARVQDVIREDFGGCTVVTVAHRLETIVDSDLVVVMDAGVVAETGRPEKLLGLAGSKFKALWDSRRE